MQIEYAKVSALGDRQDNQDRAAIVVSEDAALLLVFDGMGGHSDGAVAAETGLKTVQDLFVEAQQPIFDPQGFLYMALSRAHDEVVRVGADVAVDFRPGDPTVRMRVFLRFAISCSTTPSAYPGANTTSAWAASTIASTVSRSTTRLVATMPPNADRGSQSNARL